MSAIRWQAATTRWRNCSRSPTPGWTPTATCPARRSWRRRFSPRAFLPSPLVGEGGLDAKHRGRVRGSSPRIETPHPAGTLSAPPSPTRGEGKNPSSIRAEHELAVAFEVRAGAHVELTILADEEQRAVRHILGALEEQASIV